MGCATTADFDSIDFETKKSPVDDAELEQLLLAVWLEAFGHAVPEAKGLVWLWDVTDGCVVAEAETDHGKAVNCVGWRADGRQLLEQVLGPSRTPMMYDYENFHPDTGAGAGTTYGGKNVLFCDGHVEH